MALNTGYLKSNRTKSGDDMFTPFYAVEPIVKYISKDKKIWMPFDEEWSAFYQRFKELGYSVIRSSLSDGQNFFTYEPDEHYDIIISNPPFSEKDKVLKRLYELNKPFAILLPVNSIQGTNRYKYFKNGIQMLVFDARMGFHNPQSMQTPIEGTPFATGYFCRDVLPNDLILEELKKFERSLI